MKEKKEWKIQKAREKGELKKERTEKERKEEKGRKENKRKRKESGIISWDKSYSSIPSFAISFATALAALANYPLDKLVWLTKF